MLWDGVGYAWDENNNGNYSANRLICLLPAGVFFFPGGGWVFWRLGEDAASARNSIQLNGLWVISIPYPQQLQQKGIGEVGCFNDNLQLVL